MEEPISERPGHHDVFPERPQQRTGLIEMLEAAEFMSRDSDRRVFNRFDEPRIFVMLSLQHRVAQYWARLQSDIRKQGGIDDETLETLTEKIQRTLKDYGMHRAPLLLKISLQFL